MTNKERIEAAYEFTKTMPRNVNAFCYRMLRKIEATGDIDAALDKNPHDLNYVSYLDLFSYMEYNGNSWGFSPWFWMDVEDWAEAQNSNQKGENNG